jgi:hypothetical protein
MQALSESWGTELSAVLFGQHVHLILILVTFSSRVVSRTIFTIVNPRTKELKIVIGKVKIFLQNNVEG